MPLNAGNFGTIPFIVPEILKISFQEKAGYIQIPIINGFPRIHILSDPLEIIQVNFRFNSLKGIGYNASAKSKLDLLRVERGSLTPKPLVLGGSTLGQFLVQGINWEIVSQAGDMSPQVVDAQVEFLANPV